MLHIAILIHRHDPYDKRVYWLKAVAECWEQNGVRVSVVRGAEAAIDADLAVLHVDLTKIPEDYLALVPRYPRVLNGKVSDISKRLVSSHLLSPGESYRGPVLVKSDRNSGGHPEAKLAKRAAAPPRPGDARLAVYRRRLDKAYRAVRRHWQREPIEPVQNYRVFASTNDVPEEMWRDPALVVERFLPERHDEFFCVRTWLFLGDQERNTMFYSRDPIIKSRNIVGHERLSEVPEELRRKRRELAFDFGKFDYAVVDGEVVLYDANRTPGIGAFPRERYFPIAQALAKGLEVFL